MYVWVSTDIFTAIIENIGILMRFFPLICFFSLIFFSEDINPAFMASDFLPWNVVYYHKHTVMITWQFQIRQ